MAVTSSRQTVGVTAVALNTADVGGLSGASVCIRNTHATIRIYVGGSNVSAANGYPVSAGEQLAVDFESSSETFYAISPDGDVEVAILQSGL